MISFVIAISCLSLVFAVFLARMCSSAIRDAQNAGDLQRDQRRRRGVSIAPNRTIIGFSAVLAALIFILYAFVRTPSPADPVPPVQLAFWTTLSFILARPAP